MSGPPKAGVVVLDGSDDDDVFEMPAQEPKAAQPSSRVPFFRPPAADATKRPTSASLVTESKQPQVRGGLGGVSPAWLAHLQREASSAKSSSSSVPAKSSRSPPGTASATRQTTLPFVPERSSAALLSATGSSASRPPEPSSTSSRPRVDFTTVHKQLASPPKKIVSSSSGPSKPMSGFGNFSISSGSSRSPKPSTTSMPRSSMPSSSKLFSQPSNSSSAASLASFSSSHRFGGGAKFSYQTPGSFHTFGKVASKPSSSSVSGPYKPSIPEPKPKPSGPKNQLMASLKAEAKVETTKLRNRETSAKTTTSHVPVRTDLKRPVPDGGKPAAGRPAPAGGKAAVARRMAGRTVFDSSTLGEDEDWGSNDALKDLIADQEALMQEKRTVMSFPSDPIRISTKKADREAQKAFEKAKLGTDMSYLDREVLSWSWAGIDGDKPPFNVKSLKKVPLVFKGMSHYREVFQPLLFLECWEQLVNTKEEMGDIADVSVGMSLDSVASVDTFLEVVFTAPAKEVKVVQLTENDLVNCVMADAPDSRPFLGKITSLTTRKDETRIVVKTASDLIAHLRTQSKYTVIRLMSLTTVHREFAAMQALDYFPLRDEIYKPRNTERPRLDTRKVDEIRAAYGVNEPQAEVIAAVLSTQSGFTLCQGPPGTGKTRTILAMIAALFREHHSRSSAPEKLTVNAARRGTHILVCAPSNAGCDEIVRRLKAGIQLPNGELLRLKVVRVGAQEAIHPENLDVFLDNLVQEQMLQSREFQQLPEKGSNKAEIVGLQDELRSVREELDLLEQQRKLVDPDSEEMAEIRVQQRGALDRKRELLAKQESARTVASEAEVKLGTLKKELRIRILDEADAVLCTLSASGQDMFPQLSQAFQTVIIDEAAQAVELSALIPLKYGAQRAVLVGDPQQLPPTVLSRHAIDLSYEQSLFERLRNAGHYSHLLSIQYRMHPDISRFPSAFFYESRLQDGLGIGTATRRDWHDAGEFRPYVFYDIRGREQTGPGHSLYNATEADAARALVDMLLTRYPRLNFGGRIGIISPYKKQVNEVKRRLRDRYGRDILNYLDVNSVDGFQGQEKDIIIFSCVRAGSVRGIGFLKDLRRLNVAITRSKASLWILGDATSLCVDSTFRSLVDDAKERGCFRQFDGSWFRMNSIPPDNWKPRASSLPGSPIKASSAGPPRPVVPMKRDAPVGDGSGVAVKKSKV